MSESRASSPDEVPEIVEIRKARWMTHEHVAVYTVDIHPDGTRVATGGLDRKVRVWSLIPFVDEDADVSGDDEEEEEESSVEDVSEDFTSDEDEDEDEDEDAEVELTPLVKKKTSKALAGGLRGALEMRMGKDAKAGFGGGSSGTGNDHAVHRCLATLEEHLGSINCVRWSHTGEHLVSASDDNTLMVWARSARASRTFGSKATNYEAWSRQKTLREHDAEVIDAAWSHDNLLLASCAIDAAVFVWDMTDYALLRKLEGHSKFVQGVSWDPIGTYLASQANDRSLIVWKTSDWSRVSTLTDPFVNESADSFFRRCDWSPDGQWLTAPMASNRKTETPIATVIKREAWSVEAELVGHQEHVVVARYNPCLFRRPGSDPGPNSTLTTNDYFSCVALGSKDNSLSVWTTHLDRPFLIARGLFTKPINDLAWSSDGRILMAASLDGTLACITFDATPGTLLSAPLSARDTQAVKQSIYGAFVGQTVNLHEFVETLGVTDPSSPARPARVAPTAAPTATHDLLSSRMASTAASIVNPLPGSAGNVFQRPPVRRAAAQPILQRQKESRTQDGKRRVQPILMSGADAGAGAGAGAGSGALPSAMAMGGSGGVVVGQEPNLKRRVSLMSTDTECTAATEGPEPKRARSLVEFTELPIELAAPSEASAVVLDTGSDGPFPRHVVRVDPWSDGTRSSLILETHASNADVTSMWTAFVAGRVNLVAGTDAVVVAATETDGAVHVFTAKTGARLVPPIILGSPVALLSVSRTARRIIALTSNGKLRVWSVSGPLGSLTTDVPSHGSLASAMGGQMTSVLNVSVGPLLDSMFDERPASMPILSAEVTDAGDAMVVMTSGTAFMYSTGADAWVRVADDSFVGSKFLASASSLAPQRPAGPLAAAQLRIAPLLSQGAYRSLVNVRANESALISSAFLESQMASALALGSPPEYLYWLKRYVKHLGSMHDIPRATALFTTLMSCDDAAFAAAAGDATDRSALLTELARTLSRTDPAFEALRAQVSDFVA